MSHREEITLTLKTPEHARALNAAITCYLLWLDAHPEQAQLREDIPYLKEEQAEIKQRVQPPAMGSGSWTVAGEHVTS